MKQKILFYKEDAKLRREKTMMRSTWIYFIVVVVKSRPKKKYILNLINILSLTTSSFS